MFGKNVREEFADLLKNKGKDVAKKIILDKVAEFVDTCYDTVTKTKPEDIFSKFSQKFTKTEIVKNEYSFVIDAPGIAKTDIKVSVDKEILSAVGQTGDRKINFTQKIGDDKVKEVKLENGILTIYMLDIQQEKVQTFDIK